MKRSERLFNQIKAFRAFVIEKSKALNAEEKDIEDLKGSDRYNRQYARIQSDRAALMKEARERYGDETDSILHAMAEKARFAAADEAPTTEAINTLQALKLRLEISDNNPLTGAELQQAVPLMGGSNVALNALRDIAIRSGVVLRMPKNSKMTSSQAEEAVKALSKSIAELYHLPTIGNRALWAEMLSGAAQSPFTSKFQTIGAFKVDVEPTSATDLIQSYTMLDDTSLSQFLEIVDSE